MLNSLVCKVFHKKEVQVVDIADALLLVALLAIAIRCGVYLVCDFYLFVEGDLPSFMFGVIIMVVCVGAAMGVGALLGTLFAIVLRYSCKHAHDVVAVCPKYAKEPKEE